MYIYRRSLSGDEFIDHLSRKSELHAKSSACVKHTEGLSSVRSGGVETPGESRVV